MNTVCYTRSAWSAADKPQEARANTIHLPEDDPNAVKLMLHYFYHLDYPHLPAKTPALEKAARKTSAVAESSRVAFGTVDILPVVRGSSSRNEFPGEPQAYRSRAAPGTYDSYPSSSWINAMIDSYRGHLLPSHPTNLNHSTHHSSSLPGRLASPPPPQTRTNMVLHARVYALAEKYAVDALKWLAVDKFKAEAAVNWATDDFRAAVREVYAGTVESDRAMRDAVIKVMGEHPQVLVESGVREMILELDLSFEILMELKADGHWGWE